MSYYCWCKIPLYTNPIIPYTCILLERDTYRETKGTETYIWLGGFWSCWYICSCPSAYKNRWHYIICKLIHRRWIKYCEWLTRKSRKCCSILWFETKPQYMTCVLLQAHLDSGIPDQSELHLFLPGKLCRRSTNIPKTMVLKITICLHHRISIECLRLYLHCAGELGVLEWCPLTSSAPASNCCFSRSGSSISLLVLLISLLLNFSKT